MLYTRVGRWSGGWLERTIYAQRSTANVPAGGGDTLYAFQVKVERGVNQ